jgi:16S rRNA (cytosine967-C5)-methyltransferase
VSPARSAAYDILLRVLKGGYASDLLLERTDGLDSRDAGLASQIVFGCLRYRAQLDFLIDHYAGRPAKTEPGLRVALWMGIYQLRYLDRIPRHAAVDESVELAKKGGKRFAAGFANAVLRKVDRAPVEWPSKPVELSCPQWLLDRWTRQFDAQTTEGIARAALLEPETYQRGERTQDIGSQSIVPLLELAPGQTFLDLCSAPGNKTLQALESGVQAVACDLHLSRLRNVPPECRRVALDASAPLPFSTLFDKILVDAPCSGTGTLARNPEIKWRLEASKLLELQRIQVSILKNGLAALKPGGRLVYSTCSLEKEENQDVAASVSATVPNVKLVQEMQRLPGREPGDGFYAAVLTSEKPANG